MPRGFTLIELMVVVGIVGIAGAVAAFNMADQVKDARATADVHSVVEELRAEQRLARERMQGLKVTSSGHEIVFQSTRGPHCETFDGTPRVRRHTHAALSVLLPSTGLCLDDRGEPDMEVGGVVGSLFGTTAPPEPVLTVKANLSGPNRVVFTALRIERTGISEISTRKISSGVVATIEAALISDFPATAAILAGPIKGVLQLAGGGGGGGGGFPPPPPPPSTQCVDPGNGQLVPCVDIFNF